MVAEYEAVSPGVGNGYRDSGKVLVEWADLSVDDGVECFSGCDGYVEQPLHD